MAEEITNYEGRYCQQVALNYNRISLPGLLVEDQPERDPRLDELPVDEIFITLALDASRAPSRSYNRGAPEEKPIDLRSVEIKARIDRRLPLSVGDALDFFKRLIVFGAPGSGKTTLLRWLAVTFAENRQARPDRLGSGFEDLRLPVLLELRRFAHEFGERSKEPHTFDLAAEASDFIAKDARFAETPQAVIRDAITAGRCLILLDGLDEIADRATRSRVAEAIEALYLDPRRKSAGNLCILTTRVHGFAGLSQGFRL